MKMVKNLVDEMRKEFEQLIYDDKDFKENWANEDGGYYDYQFYEWFQSVIETSSFNDLDTYFDRNLDEE